jgi:hypothetical protein
MEDWIKDLREFVCEPPDASEFFSKDRCYSGEINFMWGKTHSKEVKELLSKLVTGRKVSNETKEKISKYNLGKKWNRSQEWRENCRIAALSRKPYKEEVKEKQRNNFRKHYKFTSPTGEIYEEYCTIREFSKKYDISRGKIKRNWTVEELAQDPPQSAPDAL